jgi:two-component system sensor histidine kinase KdpD
MVDGAASRGCQHHAVTRQDAVKTALGPVGAAALVAAATALGRALGVDLTAAALLLLLVVLVATLVGRLAGAVATVLGFLALNYFFTDPRESLDVNKGDDLVALAAFAVASGVLGWTITRLSQLRNEAERRRRETQIRLDLTSRILAGEDPDTVLAGAADALLTLFDLVECTVRAGTIEATARVPGVSGPRVIVQTGELEVELVPTARALSGSDRALAEALVAGLAAAVDRIRLEAEAREARVEAQVGRTRSSFLSAVTHNLRTPLASIKAAASTLRAPEARLDPQDRAELLETVYDETDRLERLVNNILELSRIRAGALEVHRELVDVRDLAQGAVRRLRPLARAHRVRLDVAVDIPELPADVEMMDQVFGNLLENALRFAPPGSEILVTARRVGDAAEVRVADHGPGVAPEDRERIFDEFVRVDARPDATGTGLGLAIVRALVTAHDGRVWCEETAGGGATFVFSLPFARR